MTMAPTNQYLNKLKKRDYKMYQYFLRGMEIVKRLNEKMYEAYIVGGAVRDYLLNTDFKDIDIATSATPKEILELFPSGDSRYSDLGCVELKENDMVFQITTFRDEQLVTSRKTKDIHYSKKLTDDVLRRDFTVNALALSSNYNVIDIIKGEKDIKNKIVRVIGKGKRKFHDDPLRILRGIELVAKYNFKLSGSTFRSMRMNRKYLRDISEMKLSEMLWKILNAPFAREALYQMIDMDLFSYDVVYRRWLIAIYRRFKKMTVEQKFALLYYLYGSIPQNTCFSRTMISALEQIIQMVHVMEEQPVDAILIYKYGARLVNDANQVLVAKGGKYKNQAKLIKKYDQQMVIRSRKDLNFTAEELIQMMNGKTGPKVTEIMDLLTNKVIRGEVLNNNSLIRQEALRILAIENRYEQNYNHLNQQNFSSTDHMLASRVLVNEEVKKEELKNHPNDVVQSDSIDIEVLKVEYTNDFRQLYAIYMKGIVNYDEMTEEQKEQVTENIKEKVRSSLLQTNSKYLILAERGII